ncbi:TIGR02453 family protein [Deltaproteobacteria bacterium]|nr:TIGR02453 family protein [Deltaproteobacteria bacterium]
MSDFVGFSPAAVEFLADLRRHNDRAWFAAHRDLFETLLLEPARDLVADLGVRFQRKRPALIADPRVDRSIYRLNRDTRFSPDKSPYKTHLALWFWEGAATAARLECPGFYLHLDPDFLGLSVGCYRFSDRGLAAWRAALGSPKTVARLKKLVRALEARGHFPGEPELKRTPAGFAPDHPAADFLRHKGFYTWSEIRPHPPEIFGPEALEYLFQHWSAGLGLHAFLTETLT